MDACDDVLSWRCSAARSTMRASSSEHASLSEGGSKEGEAAGDTGGESGAVVARLGCANGRAAWRLSCRVAKQDQGPCRSAEAGISGSGSLLGRAKGGSGIGA